MIKIPSRQDYEKFLRDFTDGISKEMPSACFYTYGSIDNSNFVPGISDIDGGIILDSGVVTPKEDILTLVELLSKSLGDTGIKAHFNLLDRQTCRDGRFLSYTVEYTEWIKKHGNIRSGPDYTKEMRGLDFKSNTLNTASFNFCGPRGVRNTFLYSLVYANGQPDEFIENTSSALEKFAKFPKKLVWLRTGKIIPSKDKAKQRLEKVLIDVDFAALEKVNSLLKNPSEFYGLFENPDDSVYLLTEALGCMEHIVESYIKHFPKIGKRELTISLWSRIKAFFS
jgi:hypothetical protein